MSEPGTHGRARKALVENSLVLRVSQVLDALDARLSGAPALLCARRPDGSGDALEIRLEPRSRNRVRLACTLNGEPRSYTVSLVAVPQHFGGVRWSFCCPLLTPDSEPCTRRVRALYLPPGRRYFGCRWCHDLTYRSVQRPVVSRLRFVAGALEQFQQDLDSPDTLTQVAAIISAREVVRTFLASVETR